MKSHWAFCCIASSVSVQRLLYIWTGETSVIVLKNKKITGRFCQELSWSKTKRCGVKEWTMRVVYWVNKKFKDCKSIEALPYNIMYNNIYISWWVYFVTGLNLVLQQPMTAVLAKTMADTVKKSSYCLYLSHQSKKIKFEVIGARHNMLAKNHSLTSQKVIHIWQPWFWLKSGQKHAHAGFCFLLKQNKKQKYHWSGSRLAIVKI